MLNLNETEPPPSISVAASASPFRMTSSLSKFPHLRGRRIHLVAKIIKIHESKFENGKSSAVKKNKASFKESDGLKKLKRTFPFTTIPVSKLQFNWRMRHGIVGWGGPARDLTIYFGWTWHTALTAMHSSERRAQAPSNKSAHPAGVSSFVIRFPSRLLKRSTSTA